MSEPDAVPATDAATLTASVNGLAAAFKDLHKRSRHNLFLIRMLTVSVVLDVVLSVGLGLVAFNAHDASVKASNATSVASQTRQSQFAVCTAGNAARAGQIELWHYVLTLIDVGNSVQTPAQQAYLMAFREYIDDLFASRDCNHLDITKPSPKPPPLPPSTGR